MLGVVLEYENVYELFEDENLAFIYAFKESVINEND